MNPLGYKKGTRVVWVSEVGGIIKSGRLVDVSTEANNIPGLVWDEDPNYIIAAKASNPWWKNVEPFPTVEAIDELKRKLRALENERTSLLKQLEVVR